MRLALEAAQAAADDIPVGAVVLDVNGRLLARACNRRQALQDPTAHAEVLALRQAAAALGTWRLTGCTLAVTLEPCPMCAGAAALARVDRVVFGAWNEEYGACGSRWDILRDRRMAHRPEVVGGVLGVECGTLVREFLQARRDSDDPARVTGGHEED
ncbi:MAG: nucleoside deaminase [Actinomycetales bacterium]|nr:nucleoside deaminase [Actinomycetales bacterium]